MKIHLKKKLKLHNQNLNSRKIMNTLTSNAQVKTIDLSQFSAQQLKEALSSMEKKKMKKERHIKNW